MKKIIILLYLLIFIMITYTVFSNPLSIFPEDGSLRMKYWYYSRTVMLENIKSNTALKKTYDGILKAFAKENIQVRDIGYNYDWIQDISLFSKNGALLLQSYFPLREDILDGLTEGVFNAKQGYWELKRLDPLQAFMLKVPFKQMLWTFVEGGEMISGCFANGQPYVIINELVRKRAKAYYKNITEKNLNNKKAQRLIAKDLGVPYKNVFFVELDQHLDLFICPLPGGKILLHDYWKTVPVLRNALKIARSDKEKRKLKSMLHTYNKGHHLLNPYDKKSTIISKPFTVQDVIYLNKIFTTLKKRFKIIRVAGFFKEMKMKDKIKTIYNINFLNGIIGRNKHGKLFNITNMAEGFLSLELYWLSILKKQGINKKNCHFVGMFEDGAGLDCMGAQSGGY